MHIQNVLFIFFHRVSRHFSQPTTNNLREFVSVNANVVIFVSQDLGILWAVQWLGQGEGYAGDEHNDGLHFSVLGVFSWCGRY
jgi:hypothetical protein